MTRLDSTTLEIPIIALKDWKQAAFYDTVSNSRNMEKWTCQKPGVGIGQIEINPRAGHIVISASAKTLKDDYLQGININTIERFVDEVNSTGIIELGKADTIDCAKIRKTDITDNLSLQHIGWGVDECLDAIQSSVMNPLFHVDRYSRKNNKGIAFIGGQKSEKNRQIFYSKGLDLRKADNKPFLGSCKNPLALLTMADNMLRCESNHTSFRSIRNRLKVSDTGLLNVLNSNIKANYNMFIKVLQMPPIEQLELFARYDPNKYNLAKVVAYEGYRGIIKQCNYNADLIKNYIAKYEGKENAKHYWYGTNGKISFKALLQEMKLESKTEKPALQSVRIVEKVKELLLAA